MFAILPPLGRSVGLDEIRITAIISTSALVFTLVAPFWGRFSDQIGRKPVILIGLMGYCIGSLAFAVLFSLAGDGAITTGLTLFIIALIIRSLQAATMSATSPGCTAYAADHTVARFRIKTLARLSSANSIGMIMGPVMAGLVAGLGLLAPLVVASFMSGLAAVIIGLKLSKGVKPRATQTHQRRLGYLDARLRVYLFSAIGAFTGFAMVQQTLAFRLQDVLSLSGIETAQYTGWAMMVSAASSLFMQMVIAQRLLGHHSTRALGGRPAVGRHRDHQRAGQLGGRADQHGPDRRRSGATDACRRRRCLSCRGAEEQGACQGW